MSDLLPPNATLQEKALSETTERLSEIPPAVRDVWNADTCPAGLLPWLAWAFSVDSWQASWSEQQKRDTIKRSVEVHKYKGTIGAVRAALDALGITSQVIEWFQQAPQGDPYTFQIVLESHQTPVTQAGIADVLEVVDMSKNLRSHLDQITIQARSDAPIYAGAVASVGSEITLQYQAPLPPP